MVGVTTGGVKVDEDTTTRHIFCLSRRVAVDQASGDVSGPERVPRQRPDNFGAPAGSEPPVAAAAATRPHRPLSTGGCAARQPARSLARCSSLATFTRLIGRRRHPCRARPSSESISRSPHRLLLWPIPLPCNIAARVPGSRSLLLGLTYRIKLSSEDTELPLPKIGNGVSRLARVAHLALSVGTVAQQHGGSGDRVVDGSVLAEALRFAAARGWLGGGGPGRPLHRRRQVPQPQRRPCQRPGPRRREPPMRPHPARPVRRRRRAPVPWRKQVKEGAAWLT